jgi:hypothetical protein
VSSETKLGEFFWPSSLPWPVSQTGLPSNKGTLSVNKSGNRNTVDSNGSLSLFFGWWALLCYVSLGITLEVLHGLKIGWYLEIETRRLMWTLGHAHGGLLALVNVVFVDSKLKRNFPVFVENFLGCSIPESLTWSIIDSLCDAENITIRHESKV